MAVRRHAGAHLKAADGRPRLGAEDAVDTAGIKAARCETALQLLAFGPFERLVSVRPPCGNPWAPCKLVGEAADGERVSRRYIVAQDGFEIPPDQECRSAVACRQLEPKLPFRAQPSAALGHFHAVLLPVCGPLG